MLSRSKTYPDPSQINLNDNWDVGYGLYDEMPVVFSIRHKVKSFAGHPAYPDRLTVRIKINAPIENGFPGKEESAQIYEMQDVINARLEAGNRSLLVAMLFKGGYRDLVFYTSAAREAHDICAGLAGSFPSHEMSVDVQPDPDWSELKGYGV
jgi:hypothetical protein